MTFPDPATGAEKACIGAAFHCATIKGGKNGTQSATARSASPYERKRRDQILKRAEETARRPDAWVVPGYRIEESCHPDETKGRCGCRTPARSSNVPSARNIGALMMPTRGGSAIVLRAPDKSRRRDQNNRR